MRNTLLGYALITLVTIGAAFFAVAALTDEVNPGPSGRASPGPFIPGYALHS